MPAGWNLGFNGDRLLRLTLGRGFAKDLRYVATGLGVAVGDISITVLVTLEGLPIRAIGAETLVSVRCPKCLIPRRSLRKRNKYRWP